jgi:hypothetical protein
MSRDTGRRRLTNSNEDQQAVIRPVLQYSTGRMAFADGIDQDNLQGVSQAYVRQVLIAKLQRKINFHFITETPPLLPEIVRNPS